MRIARQIGLLLVTVCALGAMAVSSASAGQPLFLFHGTGKILGGNTTGTGAANQVLSVHGLKVECESLSAEATIKALRALNILLTARFTNCTLPAIGAPATVHPVLFLVDANGLVKLENNATVLVPALGEPLCVITLPAATNQSLLSVKFENTTAGSSVLLLSSVNNIHANGVGGGATKACEFAEEGGGTFTGSALHLKADNAGGLFKWDPNA
jgi:hypothetical protein